MDKKSKIKKKESKIRKGVTKEDIINILKEIYDPELGIDVWSLKLIYDIKISENKVDIKMTLTTPLCPYGPMLIEEIKEKIEELKVKCDIDLVFDPPWEPPEELRSFY